MRDQIALKSFFSFPMQHSPFLAKQYNTRLHVFHISTEKECFLFDNTIPLEKKRITSEVCIHHLHFDDSMYQERGSFIKWNPAVKKKSDKNALLKHLLEDRIEIREKHFPMNYHLNFLQNMQRKN